MLVHVPVSTECNSIPPVIVFLPSAQGIYFRYDVF